MVGITDKFNPQSAIRNPQSRRSAIKSTRLCSLPRHSSLANSRSWLSLAVVPFLAPIEGRSNVSIVIRNCSSQTSHRDSMQGPEGILTTTVDGQRVSIFDPRTPGYDQYVAPFQAYFNPQDVLYTVGGKGWAQRFVTRVVPAARRSDRFCTAVGAARQRDGHYGRPVESETGTLGGFSRTTRRQHLDADQLQHEMWNLPCNRV